MRELANREWTQTQLEKASGVSRSTVDSWQFQPRPPRVATIRSVASAIDLDLSEALRLAGYPESRIPQEVTVAAPTPAHSPAKTALADTVRELRDEAEREGRSLGELLVRYGLAQPEELAVPDALPPDPIIVEIQESSDISEETKKTLIRLHLENRARRFEEERLKAEQRKKPGS
ncbi:helix-turn-helix domain-containing protein [Nonomuraea sp. NBC_01738]|uniref:helix-turn-helix domain-containing protein n=1 Tax=Nonomuraea sp. NBC_01738 TaxID=2976003 RepID=UPI002E1628DE|nr:helix-turn-helix domain-containing protein [Nonomuraea sp. NBC_01738]